MESLLTSLRAAGETTRLRIIALLSKGELTVGELVQILNQSQPRVSRHLKLMCDSGLLDRFQEGTQVFYRLAPTGVGGALNAAVVPLIDSEDSDLLQDFFALDAIRVERSARAQDYFRANAADWDKIRSLYVAEEQVESALLDLLGNRRIKAMIDVGTGTGRMLELFAPLADQALGIDVSREMLAIARSQLAAQNLSHCQVRLGDMYDMGVPAGTQDLIVFHQVLHFADKPSAAIAEAAHALAVDGVLLVADFAPHAQEFLRDEHAHRRLGFADNEVNAWGDAAGLAAVSVTHLDGGDLRVSIWKFVKSKV
ncbi:ArsR/SmtB family transcription factor [Kordiimonas aquimaris]|uniref:ArsR/SmtB family transcription factor n=1 Tax=Kordiimonas aquimaris TaxID=707591 RepID=UPI0021D28F7B|nr:metalloregulator ArsR/SmtB family transcription factor [Kordiimonas aquimaris]